MVGSSLAYGTIVDLGGAEVTEHGHCWSTTVDPTTSDSKTTLGAGVVGGFNSNITGLTVGTAYYIRAYATNSYGTGYGNNIGINDSDGPGGPGGGSGDKGSIAVKDERFVYVSKTAKRYYIQGVEY